MTPHPQPAPGRGVIVALNFEQPVPVLVADPSGGCRYFAQRRLCHWVGSNRFAGEVLSLVVLLDGVSHVVPPDWVRPIEAVADNVVPFPRRPR